MIAAGIDGRWLRPAAEAGTEDDAGPRWGHRTGLQVGLHPLTGPRGLLRIYAPYLDHPNERLINFIAVEPIPTGATTRGLSELEASQLDGVAGKRFWSADDPADTWQGALDRPARGVLETVDGVERLRVVVGVERFVSGAEVFLTLTFRADRPHEIGLAASRRPGSAPLDRCILSATMGNFARLRRLELADGIVTPAELWPDFAGDHFTDHGSFGLDRITRNPGGDAVVSATPDEPDPTAATYADTTAEHWKYVGAAARQTWRAPNPDPALRVQVNGRHCYWMSRSAIPGGTSYENFELSEPFADGRQVFFSVMPLPEGDSATASP